ncbi:MAG: helix-turn-helix domain-containing protein [Fusobacterium sp.]|nr:helix-turn-helix domain-containing protein [Fusobacterium sp.]
MKDIEKYKPKLELIGKNLRKFRKAKGLTQKELAEAVSVSRDYIRKIENAKVLFSMTLLCKFCVLFKTQLKEFFED